ncbi:MAG: hypothetical protein ACK55I_14015, partial [bacterium]
MGANQFSVSTTFNGSILSITAAGSGTHTVHSASNVVPATLAVDDDGRSATSHDLYLVNSANCQVVKYNMRAALTVGALTGGPASGTSVSAFVHKTGTVAITGTISTINCGRIFTVNHGSASGVKSLYFVTTTRVYRCPVSTLTNGGTSWLQ